MDVTRMLQNDGLNLAAQDAEACGGSQSGYLASLEPPSPTGGYRP